MLDEEGKARRALDEMVAVSGERHPAVQRLRLSLTAVQERLQKQLAQSVANIETDVQAARAAEAALHERVAALQTKSIEARGLEGQLRTLQADFWSGGRLMVARANTLMDADGRLADEATRTRLAAFIADFAAFVQSRAGSARP